MHRLIVKYAALLQPPQKFAATSTFTLLSYPPFTFGFPVITQKRYKL